MMARVGLALCLCLVIVSNASASPQAAPSSVASTSPVTVTEAEAIRVAMQALTRGQTSVTLAIDAAPADTIQERINRIHLRMNMLGWMFVGKEFVPAASGQGVLLLSYRH